MKHIRIEAASVKFVGRDTAALGFGDYRELVDIFASDDSSVYSYDVPSLHESKTEEETTAADKPELFVPTSDQLGILVQLWERIIDALDEGEIAALRTCGLPLAPGKDWAYQSLLTAVEGVDRSASTESASASFWIRRRPLSSGSGKSRPRWMG